MPEDLKAFLHSAAMDGLVDWQSYETARQLFGISYPEIERVVLEQGLFPKRYAAQQQLFQLEGQLKLFRARVAVVGCGGLGSCLVEMLARTGIGTLRLIDPDVFAESNLNRQLLCTIDSLGRPKVEVAAERIACLNPAVTVTTVAEALDGKNARRLLAEVDVVVDALDSIPVRRELAHVCRQMNLPLVHGAVTGWYGQVAVQSPGDDLVSRLYSHPGQPEMELSPDNFSAGVAAVASLQAVLAVKVLLDVEPLPANGWFSFDLREVDLERIDFGSG